MYKVRYKKDQISDDLAKLPLDARKEAIEYFKLFEKDYERYSLPLYNMYGRDLRGCRKTYFYNGEYRIVSKLENGVINIVNVIPLAKEKIWKSII